MFDGSILPYEDNINGTKEIVRICRELGISVEAELGHVANAGEGSSEGSELYGEGDDLYTKPGQARKFVGKHGFYLVIPVYGNGKGAF
jgi:fructose-bisphosphate aldolase class II